MITKSSDKTKMEQKAAVAEIDWCNSTLQQTGKVPHHKPQTITLDSLFLRSLVGGDQCPPSMAYGAFRKGDGGDQINTVPRGAGREPLLYQRPESEVAFASPVLWWGCLTCEEAPAGRKHTEIIECGGLEVVPVVACSKERQIPLCVWRIGCSSWGSEAEMKSGRERR